MKAQIILAVFLIAAADAQTERGKDFTSWPAGGSPQEIGKRVAERFCATPHPNFGRPTPPNSIIYPETCTWYGALTFAQLTGDRELTDKLIARFEPLFGDESKLIPRPSNVDSTVFGSVPLELYLQTREPKYLSLGKSFADKQWETPEGETYERLKPEVKEWVQRGLSWHTRFWIDDMFMITMVQSQAYRATGDTKYLDRATLEMVAYLDALQQPNGLFYHAPDVPYFWGRGDGWMAAGMSELLRSLPETHPHRERILVGYRKMMETLLKYQGEDGMWRQLIDHPESWPETSCTGMFTFAMITGVKHGWLDESTYGPAARKGWLALIGYLDENSDIREVCEGTNKKDSLSYYLERKRNVGDMHGQAPLLWCASALLRDHDTAGSAPATLPGKGLGQHDFLYCGEWDTRKPDQTMFLVRGGKVAWVYRIPIRDGNGNLSEFSDMHRLSNGDIVFAYKTGWRKINAAGMTIYDYQCPSLGTGPDGKTIWAECHSAQPVGMDKVLFMQNGTPAKLILFNIKTGLIEMSHVMATKEPVDARSIHGQFRNVRMTGTGNYLIAHMNLGKVTEYDKDWNEIWSIRDTPSVWQAVRLKNGNTLVSGNQHAFVREISPRGAVVWELKDGDLPGIKINSVHQATRLANGNTVICNWTAGVKKPDWPEIVQVIEVTPAKEVVWAFREWENPDLGPASCIQLLDEPGKAEEQELMR